MVMTFADMMPEGLSVKMAHMTLELSDGNQLLASDVFEGAESKGVEGVAMRVNCADAADAERLFDVMSEGGTVTMPLGKTDWAALFGMCCDQFGVGWMIDVDAG